MEASKSILRSAYQTLRTSDARGRSLAFRRPTALDTLRLFKAAGPVLAQNPPWLAMAGLAFAVEEIDGIPVPSPVNESQIELLVDRLGEQGLSAIAASIDLADSNSGIEDQVGN
jgi:hypothetical protein